MNRNTETASPAKAADRIARVYLSQIDRKIADLSATRKELAREIGSCS